MTHLAGVNIAELFCSTASFARSLWPIPTVRSFFATNAGSHSPNDAATSFKLFNPTPSTPVANTHHLKNSIQYP